MKKIWLVVIGVALLIGVVGMVGCGNQGSIGTVSNQQQGIWVSGEGKVTAVPDVAIINLGIEAQATDVAVAQTEASAAMDKLMQALKAQGIEDKDIQTVYFNISQVTQWDNNKQEEEVTGYRVDNTVTVKVRQVNKAGQVIDAAITAGGNLIRISGIDFTVDNPSPLYEQARTLAINYAKAKAEQLASETGVKLGRITYITESSYTSGGRNYILQDMVATPAPITTPVSVGQLDVTATVQIAYAID